VDGQTLCRQLIPGIVTECLEEETEENQYEVNGAINRRSTPLNKTKTNTKLMNETTIRQ
jgi:hypothetical protein